MAARLPVEPLRLSIVVPAFNEALRIGSKATRLIEAAADGVIDPSTTELIVVDDGSTDDTGWCFEQLLGKTFPHLRVLRKGENSGKGAAIRTGVAAASAPLVLFMDADMSVDPAQIPMLIGAVGTADIAIGSRSLSGSIVDGDSLHRKLMGRTFNRLVNAMTDVQFKDTQCGFKAFRTPMARLLFHLTEVDGFAFDVEVLSHAIRLRMTITEVPVLWTCKS